MRLPSNVSNGLAYQRTTIRRYHCSQRICQPATSTVGSARCCILAHNPLLIHLTRYQHRTRNGRNKALRTGNKPARCYCFGRIWIHITMLRPSSNWLVVVQHPTQEISAQVTGLLCRLKVIFLLTPAIDTSHAKR
jgi:hypothetical protein